MGKASNRLLPLTVSVPYVTAWASYTPTGSWTNSTYTGNWRRVGDTIEIQAALVCTGTPSGSSLSFSIPAGITVDTAKLPRTTNNNESAIGVAMCQDEGVNTLVAGCAFDVTNSLITIFNNSTAVSPTNPFTFGTGDTVTATVRLPVSGWETHSPSGSTANSVIQGGNSFGAEMFIGTNDAQSLSFKTNSSTRGTFDSSGDLYLWAATGTRRIAYLGTTSTSIPGSASSNITVFRISSNMQSIIQLEDRSQGTDLKKIGFRYASTKMEFFAPNDADNSSFISGYIENATGNARGSWVIGPTTKINSSDYQGSRIVGKTDGSTTAAGYVGEIKVPSTETYSVSVPSTGAATTLNSLTLTPGVYYITGHATIPVGSLTGIDYHSLALSSNGASFASADIRESLAQTTSGAKAAATAVLSCSRIINVASSQTITLVGRTGATNGSSTWTQLEGKSIIAVRIA